MDPGTFFASPGGAATISAGASILDGVFGGDGYSWGRDKRRMRKQYEYAQRYQPGITSANTAAGITGAVKGAKAAGLHPLFALGQGAVGPSSPSFSMPGQSERGSRLSDAVASAQRAYQGTALHTAQKELVEAQAELSRARALEQVTSNDNAGEVIGRAPKLSPISTDPWDRASSSSPLAEYEPAKIGSHRKGNTWETGSEVSPMTTIRAGSQNIEFPIAEADQLTEDPLAALIGAYFYKGNRHVDWKKAAREYTDTPPPTDYKNYHKTPRSRIRKELFWGLVKFDRYYKRTRGQGR